MSKYICETCGKEFKQKGRYTIHLNKKKSCVNDLKIKEIVDKAFEEKISNIINKPNPNIEFIIEEENIIEIHDDNNVVDLIYNQKIQIPLKFVDLFCGIGSFHYSFKKFGWECVMSCDIDKAVKETYKENYNQNPLDDITKIEPQSILPFDILCAGFPCQPFSQCGQHKGFDDERGTLFFNIMKFVKFHNPKIIILENVQGILNHDSGNTFQTIITQIDSLKLKHIIFFLLIHRTTVYVLCINSI